MDGDKGVFRKHSFKFQIFKRKFRNLLSRFRNENFREIFRAPVTQLDRVTGFEPVSWVFESPRARHVPFDKTFGFISGTWHSHKKLNAGVAELADAYGLGPYGQPWGFKSLRPHHLTPTTVWT